MARHVFVNPAVQAPLVFDDNGLTGSEVAQALELQHVEGNTFGSDHVIATFVGPTLAQHQRANAVRIAKCDDAETDDHRNDGITAATTVVDGRHRREHLLRG